MVGRSAQVARGLNTISANIVANSNVLQKYGIQVKSANGDLKSTYDVLTELKPVWDSLTDVERQALGQTLAGKNQYRVLASVMSNFEHATEATTTALNSQGSAMEENTAYMESLEARTNLIKKDFQDLANHVIDSQLVKSVLSLTHAFLELADTGLGRVLIQLTLLGGISWGAVHLIHASKLIQAFKQDILFLIPSLQTYTLITQELAGVQSELAIATAAAAGSEWTDAGAKSAAASATIFLEAETVKLKAQMVALTKTILINAAAIAGAIAVFYGGIKLIQWMDDSYQHHVKTLQELNAQYSQLYGVGSEYDQLKNKTEALTAEERNRLSTLEQEKAILDEQIKREGQITYEKWRQSQYTWDSSVQGQYSDQMAKDLTTVKEQYEALDKESDNYYENLQNISKTLSEYATHIKEGQEAGVELDATSSAVLDFYNSINEELNEYYEQQQIANDEIEEAKTKLELLVEQLNALKDAFSSLQSAYDDFNEDNKLSYSTITDISEKFSELDEDVLDSYIDRLTDANLTSDELNSILSDMTIALAEQRIETMGLTQDDQRLVEMMLEEAGIANAAEIAAYLLRDAKVAEAEATDDATDAIEDFNNTPVDSSSKVGQVDNITSAFGTLQQKIIDTHRQFNAFMDAESAWSKRDRSNGYVSVADLNRNYREAQNSAPVVEYHSGSNTGRGGGGGGSSRSTTEKELTYLEQKEKELKVIEDSYSNILSLIESEYNLLEDQGAPVEDIIAKAKEYQDQLHAENEELREFLAGIEDNEETHEFILELQAKINQNSSKWWDWANKIAKKYEDIAEEAQKAAEATAEAMDKLREAWDKDVEEQKEALEALQKQMEDYYQGEIDNIDAQIDALKATNEELQDQITYEEKLDAIAQARQKKAMVYKDGRWQYIEDVDAVSTAVKAFEDYQRDKAFNEQVANLEKEKDALELVKKAWSDMTKSVENDKDRWLIAQKLGIDTSTTMWQQYIKDMEQFVNQYRNLTFAMNPYGTQQLVGSGGQTLGYTTTTTAKGTVNYTSQEAIDFIEGRSGKTEMTGADGSTWIRMSDGRTLITGADGVSAIVDPNNIGNIITSGISATASSGGSSSSSLSHTKTTGKNQSSVPSVSRSKYASGTLSALGGLSLVGEHGAELRVLNSGDGILPADITRNLMAWGQTSPLTYIGNKLGQGMNVTIQALNLPNVVDGQGFVEYIRNNLFGQVLSYVH